MLNHACREVTNVHVSSINSKTTLIRFLNPELTGNMTQLYSCKTPGWLGRCSLSDPKSHSRQDKQSQAPWSTAGSGPRWGKSHSSATEGVEGTQEMAGPWNECPLTISTANVDSDWISRTKWRRNSASPLRLTGGNNQASPKESGVWTEEVGGSEHLSPENWSKSYILPTSRVEEAPNSI